MAFEKGEEVRLKGPEENVRTVCGGVYRGIRSATLSRKPYHTVGRLIVQNSVSFYALCAAKRIQCPELG